MLSAKPRFHPSPRAAGLHMGCNRRCRNQQQRMDGARAWWSPSERLTERIADAWREFDAAVQRFASRNADATSGANREGRLDQAASA
jgi:hypothetical protein